MLTVPRGSDAKHGADTVEYLCLDPAYMEARCCRCGDRVEHPAVVWHCWVGEPIYLHRDCAADFARGLQLDVEKFDAIGSSLAPAALEDN